jgi:4'-phosphopantetheinyl transferase
MIADRLQWSPPAEGPSLASDRVHVWRAFLNVPAARVQSLQRTLAAEELRRAKRYHFQKDRDRFVVARGFLRAILSEYLRTEASQLCFRYNRHGKPELLDSQGLRFNVSHSDELALYAISRDREIGIDLERIRPELAGQEIAERFFSPREVASLRALPEGMQADAFFACWTRKEAYLKAKGQGIVLGLDQFDVSLSPGEPAALLHVIGHPEEAARWSLQELRPAAGYIASVAVEGHGWQLRCWQWMEAPAERATHGADVNNTPVQSLDSGTGGTAV